MYCLCSWTWVNRRNYVNIVCSYCFLVVFSLFPSCSIIFPTYHNNKVFVFLGNESKELFWDDNTCMRIFLKSNLFQLCQANWVQLLVFLKQSVACWNLNVPSILPKETQEEYNK